MLKAQDLPIYDALYQQRARNQAFIQQDLMDLRLGTDDDMQSLVTKHFNHAKQVRHPEASRYYVILTARIQMLEYSVNDIERGQKENEAVQRIGNIENLFERDSIRIARQRAGNVIARDHTYLKASNRALIPYIVQRQ